MQKSYIYLFLFVFFTFFCTTAFCQDFSNKGREFWVGYGSHVSMYNTAAATAGTVNASGGSQNMVLYFTSDHDATVTVEIPSVNWSRTYTVVANKVTTSDIIPKTGAEDARITEEGKSSKGIHITSDVGIIAYAHIYNGSISGASLLFPVNTLAREYYSVNYTQVSNNLFSYCYAYVIATEDNTNIEIIPSVNTFGAKAGDTIRQVLNKGEIYNIFGRVITTTNPFKGEDLTGTRIRSVATPTSPCKRIAVYSGSGKLSINCSANGSGSSDNYMQQAFPSNAWGRKYLTVPTNKMPNNFYRVAVSNPSAVVKLNGQALSPSSLIGNFYYEFSSNTANLIESDLPVMVAQYITTANSCGNNQIGGNGDPEMIYLSPIEQTIDKVTINSTGNAAITSHYVNIVIPNKGITSLKIDGNAPTNAIIHPSDNNYSYFQTALSVGSHTISSDSGFNAIAYGYGSAESYGYNAGANVKDLYQKLLVTNKFASVTTEAITCKGSPFIASITLPYKPTSLTWKIPEYSNFIEPRPIPIDSIVTNGKMVYTYKLDTALIYKKVGIYNFQVLANNPIADGCSGEQEINFDLEVSGPPTVRDTIFTNNCFSDSVQILDQTILTATDRKITHYLWDVGNGIFKDTLSNFKHKYDTAGKYNVRYYVITDIGCFSDTVARDVFVDSLPLVKFGIPKITCQNNELVFSDSTKARGISILQNWFWDYADGSAIDSLTTSSVMKHTYTKQIIYNPILTVQTANGCKNTYSIPVQNHANPNVGFILPEVCLEDAYAEFKDTTKIDDNLNNFIYQWNFNAENPHVFPDPTLLSLKADTLKNPKVKYLKPGKYEVGLKVTQRDYGCVDSIIVKFTVNGSIPKPYFLVLKDTALCSNRDVEIRDSSWVDIGEIGKLVINWGDGKDTIVETPKIDNIYKHYYANIKAPNALNLNYNIKVNASSGGVCVKDLTQAIHIVAPPEDPIVITVEDSVVKKMKDYLCISDSLYLFTTINGGVGPFIKTWTSENLNASVNGDYIHGIKGGGIALASLVVIDDKKCVYPYKNILASNNIYVREIPLAQIAAIDTVICNGAPISITGSGLGALQYNWYRNDTLITKTTTGSIIMNLPGAYKLTINDGKCNSLKTSPRAISALNITKYNFYTRDNICIGVPLEVTTSAVDQYAVHYRWDFGDGFIYTKANPAAHKYLAKGAYNIKLDVSNDYCPNLSYQIIGKPVKVATAVSPTSTKLFFLANQPSQLNSKIDPGYTSYNWDPISFLSNATIPNPVFKGDKSTDYTLTRTDTMTLCSVTDEYEIIVSTQVFVNFPNAFTPNNDGLNDVLKPAYSAGVGSEYSFRIFNRWGKLLFQTNDINKGWDGKDAVGVLQEMDSYSYFVEYNYIDPLTNKLIVVKQPGSVLLFR